MTKQEFQQSERQLAFIVSINPVTGRRHLADFFEKDAVADVLQYQEEDHPELMHLAVLNPAAMTIQVSSGEFTAMEKKLSSAEHALEAAGYVYSSEHKEWYMPQ